MSDETVMEAGPKRIITLNDGAVSIVEAEWPIVALAKWHEGALEFQPFRKLWIYVRRHATDGRHIVYGRHDTRFANERQIRGGEIVPAEASRAELADAIERLARQLRAPANFEREVLAKLPPVEI